MDAEPVFVPMTDQQLAPYTKEMIDALPQRKMQVTVVWRTRGRGALVPPGLRATSEGEAHSVLPHETIADRRVLWMYFADQQIEGEDDVVLPFPNTDVEYHSVTFNAAPSVATGGRRLPKNEARSDEISRKRERERELAEKREEGLVMHSALRGEAATRVLVEHLSVPVEVQQEHVVFNLHLFIERFPHAERCDRFVAVFNDWIVAQAVYFGSEAKRASLYQLRQEVLGWLEVTKEAPSTKAQWFLPFALGSRILALFAFSRKGFKEEEKLAEMARNAWAKGTVNFGELAAKIGKPISERDGTDSHGERDGRGGQHGYHRGGFRGFRGRGSYRGSFQRGGRAGHGGPGGQ
jgi:hypothetical protein